MKCHAVYFMSCIQDSYCKYTPSKQPAVFIMDFNIEVIVLGGATLKVGLEAKQFYFFLFRKETGLI